MDRFLAMALLLALTFSVNGIGWGRVEDWNSSSMGFRGLGRHGMPGDYLKPPLHTFVTHIVVKAPIDRIEKAASFVLRKRQNFGAARLIAARLLVVGLYLGTIVLAFETSRVFYGIFAARVIAFVFATSAGFCAYNHFLSCDSPLLFWMMLAFYFAARITGEGRRIDYVMAGLLTGAATNAKYNGLVIGISLVAAHLLSARPKTWTEKLFGRDMIIGLFMVPAGIVLTNPYILFDWNRFVSDFMYNYVVTPRYGGQASGGTSYLPFLLIIPEVLGLPGAILIAVGVIVSLVLVALRKRFAAPESLGFALALSVFALYYAKIGSFPRLGTRFVLPAVPFLILMAGPFLKAVERHWRWLAVACAPILIYNCACSYYVGRRFNDDPRMPAQVWMEANVKAGSRIESSAGSPHWRTLPRLDAVEVEVGKPPGKEIPPGKVVDLRMPRPNGRAVLFERVFKGNRWVEGQAAAHEGSYDEQLFSVKELLARNPDFVTIGSGDYQVPSETAKSYYHNLMQEKFPYRVVYDRQSPPVPQWIYPRVIDDLQDRTILLVRK
ncbi:MAG TPA: glycosyltransferase family 39 protein [Candidatus Binatus sp.]|nr:glycosyltransferase family 39 protein [Candidatus Binatus sp.]